MLVNAAVVECLIMVKLLLMQKHFQCKNDVAKQSGVIPGGECMNRLVTKRSDIRIRPRGLAY